MKITPIKKKIERGTRIQISEEEAIGIEPVGTILDLGLDVYSRNIFLFHSEDGSKKWLLINSIIKIIH